jgi:hypothetical protein
LPMRTNNLPIGIGEFRPWYVADPQFVEAFTP